MRRTRAACAERAACHARHGGLTLPGCRGALAARSRAPKWYTGYPEQRGFGG